MIKYQQRKKKSSFLISKFSWEQLSFHIGMGSLPLIGKFHKEHNDTYFDLLITFLAPSFMNEFDFKSHS